MFIKFSFICWTDENRCWYWSPLNEPFFLSFVLARLKLLLVPLELFCRLQLTRQNVFFLSKILIAMSRTSPRNWVTVNSRYLELSSRDQQICSDIESSTYRVVILCKLIRMGSIVLFETSRVRLIEYSRYRDSTVFNFLDLYFLLPDIFSLNLNPKY